MSAGAKTAPPDGSGPQAESWAEAALKNEPFRRLVEVCGDWLWEADSQGRYQYCSPQVQKILGREPSEMLGKSILDFIAEDDRERMSEALEAAHSDRTPLLSMVHVQMSADGRRVTLETNAQPTLTPDGPFAGLRGSHRDITREIELESQLRYAQKMDVVGRLTAGIAHDFNNQLTSIIGCSALLLDEMDEGNPQRVDIQHIKAAGDRAAVLTRQLQSFHRNSAPRLERVNANDVAGNTEKTLRRILGEDIELVLQMEPGLLEIMADPGLIEQIILHLAANAREALVEARELRLRREVPAAANPPGDEVKLKEMRLIIQTETRRLDEEACRGLPGLHPGGYTVLTMSDTGAGIPAEDFTRLFDPGYKNRLGGGVGQALSAVRAIAERLGGALRAQSSPIWGSRFEVFFPHADASEPPIAKEQGNMNSAGNETILVVEDEDVVRQLVVRILQMLGYHVLQAQDGAEGLAICRKHQEPISLVITDMIMPKMSGKELVARLRKSNPDLKALFLSGYTSEDTVDGVVIGQDTPLIQKPFSREDLARKVREILNR